MFVEQLINLQIHLKDLRIVALDSRSLATVCHFFLQHHFDSQEIKFHEIGEARLKLLALTLECVDRIEYFSRWRLARSDIMVVEETNDDDFVKV